MSVEDELAFVDTNVLVYALERTGTSRNLAAQELVTRLIDDDRIRLSTQVLQELFVALTRKVRRPCTAEEALARLEDLTAWPLFVVDYSAIRDAGPLARDAVISFWDALIVVAASRSGASRLYTEDLNSGQTILGVTVVNPFHELAAG